MPRNAVPGFAEKLRSSRERAGLSQQQLADLAETHPDSIVKLEAGQRQPSLELAWRLAVALDLSMDDFVPPRNSRPTKKRT